MSSLDENPEEVILRKFLQGTLELLWKHGLRKSGSDEITRGAAALCSSAKPHDSVEQDERLKSDGAEGDDQKDLDHVEEEDPYDLIPEDIYDTVDADSMPNPLILNRPPAPLPRPETEPEKPVIVTGMTRLFFFAQEMSGNCAPD